MTPLELPGFQQARWNRGIGFEAHMAPLGLARAREGKSTVPASTPRETRERRGRQ